MKLSESQVWRILGWTAVGFGFLIAIAYVVSRDKDKPTARRPPIASAAPATTAPVAVEPVAPVDPRSNAEIVAEGKRREAALHAETLEADTSVEGLRRQYLAKLSTTNYTLSVGGDGTAVIVTATPCGDGLLGVFETDLGEKLKTFGFRWLVCADQGSRRKL